MFVSDARLNISKEDDDIQDQAENRPHLTSTNNHCIKKKKKNKFMVTNKNKKKKKKDVSFRESYSTSDHRSSGGGGGGGGGNIDFNKPTKVIFFPFNNPNKFFYKKSSPFSPSSSSSTAAVSGNACFPGKISRPIFFCFKQPPTLESSSTSATLQSQTSDPNNPNFTFDRLKSLIENNDFFSKQCNPHSL
ncbi:hypothetical protein BDE02_05G001100 [Populus trichocarpa]|jgi:hypothetical protein|nr:hypothetical protein BDE02_05G001100 [Populus trichocarpa]